MKNNFIDYPIVEYTKESIYDCESYGCIDVCRCLKINNVKIINININELSKLVFNWVIQPNTIKGLRKTKISQLFGDSFIDKYCIDRILTINKVWNKSIWQVEIVPGYYGEEISKIYMNEDIFKKVINECYKSTNLLTTYDKIKYLLKLEYGVVLDYINDFNQATLIKIKNEDIDKSHINLKHSNSVINETHYINYGLPRGVVRKVGNKYTIIDGYHRIFSTQEEMYVFCLKN